VQKEEKLVNAVKWGTYFPGSKWMERKRGGGPGERFITAFLQTFEKRKEWSQEGNR